MTRPAADDFALIRAALGGDRRAGEALAVRLAVVPRILAAIDARRGHALPAQDLDDLAQDVIVILWQKLDRFGGVGTLESWLHRFCLLEYQNRIRQRSRRGVQAVEVDPPAAAAPEQRLPDLEAVENELRRLGPPEEDVIRMRHYEELSFEDIARALGVPIGTVKTRYHRGILWLRGRLARAAEELRG